MMSEKVQSRDGFFLGHRSRRGDMGVVAGKKGRDDGSDF